MKIMGHGMHQPWDGYCFEQRKQRPVSNESPPAAVALCSSVPVPWNVSPPMATTGTQATSTCEAAQCPADPRLRLGTLRHYASDKDRLVHEDTRLLQCAAMDQGE